MAYIENSAEEIEASAGYDDIRFVTVAQVYKTDANPDLDIEMLFSSCLKVNATMGSEVLLDIWPAVKKLQVD